MKLSKKFISAAAATALVSTGVISVSPTYAAEVNTSVENIVIDVEGSQIVVEATIYGEVLLGIADPELTDYLKNGQDTPKVTSLQIGDKYVDITAYGEQLLLADGDVDAAAAAAPAIEPVEFKTVEFDETTGEPILTDIAPVELVVTSVSAITGTTIKSNTETSLKFNVNGEALTKAEFEAKYEGYTAEFKYNFLNATTKERTGIVTKSAPFKYAVQVKDAEGTAVNTLTATDYIEVKALLTTTVTEVTGVELSNDLTYVTVDETATIDLVKALNAFGEEVAAQSLNVLGATIKSSDVTTAYVTGNNITARKVGNVTFTVEFPEASKIAPVTLAVEVKAAQKATSIEAQDLKVQVADDASYATKYTILDQNGEALRTPEAEAVGGTKTVVITNEAGNVVTTFATEGVYTVTVYADTEKKVKLGSYKVTTVDVATTEIDTFEFSTDKDFLLDRNETALVEKNQNVSLVGYIDGVKLNSLEGKLAGYELRSSNEDVFTVVSTPTASNEITAVGVGTATLSLVKVEGDIETVVETIELEVVNSTPQITSLQVKGDADAIVVADVTELTAVEIASQVTAGVDAAGSDIFDAAYIDSIEYVAANQKVIVTLDSLYGGAEFTFDVVIDTDEPTITSATVGNVVGTIGEDNTITFKVASDVEYTTGTVAVSEENVKAIITYNNVPVEVSAPTVEALLTAFDADGKVLGSTLVAESGEAGVTVTLVDVAGNETVYTVNFVEAAPAEEN